MGSCFAQRSLSSPRVTNHRGRLFSQVSLSYRSPCHKIVAAKDTNTEKLAEEIGLNRHAPTTALSTAWNYTTLEDPPALKPENKLWVTSIYRGLIPAKNIERRDFAIAGALVFDRFIHLRLSLTRIPFSHEVYRESWLYERGSGPLDRFLLPRR